MEPIVTVASAIATLILSEAFKEGGKSLGKGVSEKITQLLTVIREKFKASGTEGLLTRVEKQPTEPTVAILEAELVTQMSEDEIFAQRLAELVKQLEEAKVLPPSGGNIQTGASFKDVQFTSGDSSTFNVGNTTQNN
ncbi:hypothetical protein WA1_51205 [Scytonema hofmannii PCC 7110]|uniref:Uncharacterized protein n=1 Tax=Scytonema hofmannii PCC 7110 TaxID=128403 RepID=A0A139WQ80_9CYAN|nr:hypothetical protein [Scytonema hofmannii]KYC34575.1 hypothetical protein WA1_51205 [Scytonema hofmannii PCC 7110]